MNNLRLSTCFQKLRKKGHKALVPYLTAGDPDPKIVVELMLEIAKSGADIIELGVPFSDPMADGPVIQRSSERSLKRGTSLLNCLDWVQEFRKFNNETPIVLMGYANPIEKFGIQEFAVKASSSGVDGVLVVDYPPEESVEFCELMKSYEVDVIFLLAPTTSEVRLKHIAQLGSGYLYYVSLRGVTGAGNIDINDVTSRLEIIRRITPLPVLVGFGISTSESAGQIAATSSDGVVIGSAIIDKLDVAHRSGKDPIKEITFFIEEVRKKINLCAKVIPK
jgi:tryptophan synthase alpha chain